MKLRSSRSLVRERVKVLGALCECSGRGSHMYDSLFW